MKMLLLNIALLFSLTLAAQSVDFEKIDTASGLPVGWIELQKDVYADSLVKYSGDYSLALREKNAGTFAVYPIEWEASSLTVEGWIKTEGLTGLGKISITIFSTTDTPETGTCLIEKDFRIYADEAEEWMRFSISDIPLCREAEKLEIVAFKNGTGKLWIDDLEFIYSHDVNPKLQRVTDIQYAAANDHEFDNGSGFSEMQAKEADIANLELLGRVWGLLKYYHPTIRKGEVNWDYELFRILPQIYNADRKSRNSTILKWINKLGAFDINTTQPIVDDLKWIFDIDLLGNTLSSRLADVVKANRTGFSYYAAPFRGVGNMAAKNESVYEDMDISDAGLKLLAIYRLWNFIEYFYPYKDLAENWASVLKISLTDMIKTETVQGYYYALRNIVNALNDSHADIGGYRNAVYESHGDHAAFFLSNLYVDGKFMVTYTFGDHANNLRVGDAIRAVNGMPVVDFIESKRKYVSVSNSDKLVNFTAGSIKFSNGDAPLRYKIDRNGVIMEQKVDVFPLDVYMAEGRQSRLPGPKQGRSIFSTVLKPFEAMPDSVIYIQAGGITSELLDSVANHYMEYPKFIIDMRGYPQTSAFPLFIENFIPKMEMAAKVIIPDVMAPGKFDTLNGDFFGSGKSLRDYKVVVLVDHNTQSHAEYCTMILQQAPNVRVLGSRTAGADANVTTIGLPNNMKIIFTGVGVIYPDGGQTQRIGLRIDEEVRQTVQGIREGRDEVLERAIQIIN